MSLIESLASPHLVAHFQRLCGVQWKYPDEVDPIFPMTTPTQSVEELNDDDVVIKNKILYYAMKLGSQLAGEPFYYAFLPVCSWVLDIAVSRKTLTSLALVMYIGQSAKDILKKPRPHSPPVIRLEKLYETEYGMPSTHTMAGTVAPFALYVFSRQLYQIPDKKCLIAATTWTAWIGISRIYLGMHTFWQVLVGVFGAGSLLHRSASLNNKFDAMLVKSNPATALTVASGMLLSYLIFRLDSGLDPETGKPRWNTARGDQAEIMGFTAGFLLGSKWAISRNLYRYLTPGDALLPMPQSDIKGSLLRLFVGGVVFLPASFILRKLTFVLFAKLARVSTRDQTFAKRHPRVELPYKFTAVFILGTLATSLVPWVLNEYGLW